MIGIVQEFNDSKGYGFIQAENGKLYFLHFSSIGFIPKTVDPGDKLNFDINFGPRGSQAINVTRYNIE